MTTYIAPRTKKELLALVDRLERDKNLDPLGYLRRDAPPISSRGALRVERGAHRRRYDGGTPVLFGSPVSAR